MTGSHGNQTKLDSVLKALAECKAMPFLELHSVCEEIEAEELQHIIDRLESEDLVRVTHKEDLLEQIIILRSKGYAKGVELLQR